MENLYTSITLTKEEEKAVEEFFTEKDPYEILNKIYEKELKAVTKNILHFFINQSDITIDLNKKKQ